MKRKLSAALLTIVLLCMCFCGSAFAAKKPSIEIITMQVNWKIIMYATRQFIAAIIRTKQ